jgi:hypothetical protein
MTWYEEGCLKQFIQVLFVPWICRQRYLEIKNLKGFDANERTPDTHDDLHGLNCFYMELKN